MPALGPPTWAVLVFFRFRYPEVPAPALILEGAVAATSGRLLLALAFRGFGRKLPAKRQESLQVLGRAIGESRTGLLASFALFAVAPLPSAQLFEAAGLAQIRLGRLLVAFFLGRLVSYSIYVGGASAAHQSLSRLFSKGLFSPPRPAGPSTDSPRAPARPGSAGTETRLGRLSPWSARRVRVRRARARARAVALGTGSVGVASWRARRAPARQPL